MAERSRPWDGTATGDAGPFSDDQWTDIFKTLLAPTIATVGVFFEQLNDLVLTGAASPVSVNTGRAMVDGSWYESDSAVSVTIPTPGANPRIDRIVLRKDWVLQTIRITRIAGAEAASPTPPAITQVDGTTWDIVLWQVFITTGGVITIYRDERDFIGQYEPAGYPTRTRTYLDDDMFIGNGAITDLESRGMWTFFVPAGAGNTIAALNLAGFGSGAIRLSHGALSAGDFIGIASANYRPSQIAAKLLMILKEPNTDADLDRVFGFVSAVNTLTPTDGVYFRNEGTVDSNWHAITRAGGVESDTDTLIALGDTWKDLEIRVRTGVVEFFIDSALVATHTSNVPSNVNKLLSLGIFDDGVAAPASLAYQDIDLVKMDGSRP